MMSQAQESTNSEYIAPGILRNSVSGRGPDADWLRGPDDELAAKKRQKVKAVQDFINNAKKNKFSEWRKQKTSPTNGEPLSD